MSTGEQMVENQRRDLKAVAAQRGRVIAASYADEGASAAKRRDKGHGLDAMRKDGSRGKFDFGEFERAMTVARVKSGIERAKAEQTMGRWRRKLAIGRPLVADGIEQAIRDHLAAGMGMLKAARAAGAGSSTVQRIKRKMAAA